MFKSIKSKVVALGAGVAAVLPAAIAHATPPTEFTLPSLPMGQFYALGSLVLGGLATVWVWRKLVKGTNKS